MTIFADNSAAVRKTCSFESKLNARWKLIDRDRFERVTINSSHVVFSEMGAFECYQTTPDVHQYTVTTAHNNGWYVRERERERGH